MLMTRITSAVVLATLCGVACESSSKTASNNSSETYDVPHYDAGPMPPIVDFSKIPDPWPADTVAACKAYQATVSDGGSVIPQTIQDCYCDNCLELVHQCDALEGCKEIVACGYETGCAAKGNLPLNCYFFGTDAQVGCTAVIDKWGNTGAATYLADKIGDCGAAAACPTK